MLIITKIIIYNFFLRPIWAYKIKIWGGAKPTQTRTIQAFHSITSALWYISNNSLHNDLNIETINQLVKEKHYFNFHRKLYFQLSLLIYRLSAVNIPDNLIRRLNRK